MSSVHTIYILNVWHKKRVIEWAQYGIDSNYPRRTDLEEEKKMFNQIALLNP